MAPMTLPLTHEILDSMEHLPIGATLVVPQVSWDDYEILLDELVERPHFRVSYNCGRLEIVSPSKNHEKFARFFDDLVGAYADAFKMDLEKLGQTTWRRKAVAKGAEPDACYYVEGVERSLQESNGPESEPLPDIVIEIDITRNSKYKFEIYSALSVPEFWTYNGTTVQLYQLVDGKYLTIPESRFLPGITGQMLAESVEISKARGQRKARQAFRRRIQSLKKKG